MATFTEQFGTYGIWVRVTEITAEDAQFLESLGFGTIWLGGSPPDLDVAAELVNATERITVATGITNIWNTNPGVMAAEADVIESAKPGRFVLGVGAGHREATAEYQAPMQAMRQYLDGLDDAGLGKERRVLAALGPKMLELARDRSLGAHPYLTTPEHTAIAREILGPDAFLAPEQKVVIDDDPKTARDTARPSVDKPYLHLKNYLDNLRRLGFTDEDFAGGGSDRLIDRLAFHGDAPAVASALREHLRAGADHVAVQVLAAGDGWRDDCAALASALGTRQAS